MATYTGGPGNDVFDGTPDPDTMNGNDGNDTLNGAGGDDTLNGGNGFDVLNGGTGADTMSGGAHNDFYIVDDSGDLVIENPNEGSDRVYTNLAVYALTANVENLQYTGTGNFAGYGNGLDNQIQGGSGQDYLRGGDGNDSLFGIDGDDVLIGGAGFDVLDGGTGADTMIGGTQNDVYYVDNTGDVVTEDVGGGSDRVVTSLSVYSLGANVENLTYQGTGNFSGYGNTLDNQIIGGSSGDFLNGGGGRDTLLGQGGNDILNGEDGADTLTGGTGSDRFVFQNGSTGLGAAADRITDFVSGTDVIDLSLMDANTTAQGDQAFTYIGAAPFTGTAGELRYQTVGAETWLEGDRNGDSVADFNIILGNGAVPLATDFML